MRGRETRDHTKYGYYDLGPAVSTESPIAWKNKKILLSRCYQEFIVTIIDKYTDYTTGRLRKKKKKMFNKTIIGSIFC